MSYIKDKKKRKREDMHLLFNLTACDIKNQKEWQWKLTYYTLILYGALIGFVKLMNGVLSDSNRIILAIVAIFLTIGGVLMIHGTQKDLIKYRDRFKKIVKNLEPEAQKILDLPNNHTSWFYKFQYSLFQYVVVVAGFIFFILYLRYGNMP